MAKALDITGETQVEEVAQVSEALAHFGWQTQLCVGDNSNVHFFNIGRNPSGLSPLIVP
jgi:hypothetical protein